MRALETVWRQHLDWAAAYVAKAQEANGLITVASCTEDAIRNLQTVVALIRSGATPADYATSRHSGEGPVADFIPEPDRQALRLDD